MLLNLIATTVRLPRLSAGACTGSGKLAGLEAPHVEHRSAQSTTGHQNLRTGQKCSDASLVLDKHAQKQPQMYLETLFSWVEVRSAIAVAADLPQRAQRVRVSSVAACLRQHATVLGTP